MSSRLSCGKWRTTCPKPRSTWGRPSLRRGDRVAEDERVPREPTPGLERRRDALERAPLVRPRRQVQQRAKRAIDERCRLVQRELAHVALAQVEIDAGRLGAGPRALEHGRRCVDPDHRPPGRLRDRHGDPAVADGELDDRAVGLPRELHVPRDVLRHVRRPPVVDRRERVVGGRHEADAIVARPMDLAALEQEATAAVAAATSVEEVEEARVRYLGRKAAAAAGAARGARPRDGDDAQRAAPEARGRHRRAPRRRSSARTLDRRLREETIDVTLPGEAPPRGHLHLITQIRREVEDIFLGLGYTVIDGREVETTHYNFDGLNFPPGHPARSPLSHPLPRRRDRAAHGDVAEPDPDDGGAGAARLHRHARPRLPARHARRDAHADVPPGRGSRRRRGDHARRSRGHARLPAAGAVRRGAAHRVPHALLPLHRAVDRGVRLLPRLRRRGLPGLPPLGLDRDRRRGHGRPEALRVRRLRPGALHRLRVRLGPRAHRRAAARHPRPAGALAERPAAARASSRCASRSPGCASTSTFDLPVADVARRLAISSLEVDRVIDLGVPDTDGNLGLFRIGKVVEAGQASRTPTGSSSAASTWARASRARSSAAPGTSAPARRWRSRCPARCCRGSTSRSARRSSAASSRAG